MRRVLRQIHPTKYRVCLWAILIPVTMGSMMSPPASVLAAEGKRVAFVVGIGTYPTLPDEKQLKNSVNDAEGVSAKLAEIGFQVIKAFNLTRQGFYVKWVEVLNSLTEEDTFVLFYSGHGVQIRQQNYLLPQDIPPIDRQREDLVTSQAISLTDVLNDLTQGRGDRPPPKRAVVIIDACRDNPFIFHGSKGIKTPSGLAKPSSTRGLFIIYSSDENSISLDRLPNDDKSVKYSVFTRALLPLLTRSIKLQDLSLELKRTVLSFTRNTRVEQRPTAYDGTDGEEFCLPGCVANIAKGRREPEPLPSVQRQLEPTSQEHSHSLSESLMAGLQSVQRQPEPTNQAQSPSWLEAMRQPSQGHSVEKRPSTITGKDGAPMVLVPAGKFWMGSPDGEGYIPEFPRHQVMLDAFYMDKFEVTVTRYAEFMRATNRSKPDGWDKVDSSKQRNLPVVGVDWHDAKAYCEWAGKQLPTEAEWEKAARGTDGRTYPWGNEQPTARLANFGKGFTFTTNVYDDHLAPVDSYEAGKSPYGLHHMAGNVGEWVADWYDNAYYSKSPERNPKGPSGGEYRMRRGGSWFDVVVRSANRSGFTPETRSFFIGFRCAQDSPN